MVLEAGKMFGHYRLAGKIGEGGMGKVYRAHDTKLGRDVALKILPEAFAADAQRMARFALEAKVLASLNHPHIGAIYGLEDTDSTKALVLELIEGETLAQRMARGSLSQEEALGIALQIAGAMEAAHEKGIIHRDLKPANISITSDGTVKVLDFGLAKALADKTSSFPDLSLSPTLTAPATQTGIILGTAGYMAPEQARGRPSDRRADIWAFGVLLFEMTTGERLFDGETVTDVLAAVVRAEPDFAKLPQAAPPALKRLLRRCLAKDPRERMGDFGDVRLEIKDAVEPPDPSDSSEAAAAVSAPRPIWRRLLPWFAAGLVASTAAAGGYLINSLSRERPVVYASILPPKNTVFHLAAINPGVPVVSPDGKMIAFTAHEESTTTHLYVRRLDAPKAYILTGTEGALYPFWSPDSRYLGFFTSPEGKLKKIAASGGPPVTLCEAPNGRGGTWNRSGVIVFTPSYQAGLSTISAAGGIPAPLIELDRDRGESSYRHPFFLPDGRHFLYLAVGRRTKSDRKGAILLGSLDHDSQGSKKGNDDPMIMPSEAGAIYASGHLLFLRDRVLMAQPFTLNRLELEGEAFPVAEGVSLTAGTSKGVFSTSGNGVLAYLGGIEQGGLRLAWFDSGGAKAEIVGDAAGYRAV